MGNRMVKKAVGSSGSSKQVVRDLEKIRLRAHELYVQSGYAHGRDVEHWLQAEVELANISDKQSLQGAKTVNKR